MLTFLRKIRKSLLDGGKIRRYLFYAVGEILLVVIGILIALQINNWNEDRKTNDKAQEYRLNLMADLEADTTNINSVLKQADDIQNRLMLNICLRKNMQMNLQACWLIFWHLQNKEVLSTIKNVKK